MPRSCVLLAGAALVPARRRPARRRRASGPQTPTFKAQVEYVEVDAARHRRAGQLRPRPEEGRLPGLRGRQAADDLQLRRSSTFRSSGPSGRSSQPQPIEPDVQSNERPFDGRVYVMVLDDLHTASRRRERVKTRGAAVHRAQPRRQRSDGGRHDAAAGPTRARSSPATSGCCSRPSTSSSGRSSTRRRSTRTTSIYRQRPRHRRRRRPVERSGRHRSARSTRARVARRRSRRVADWFGGVRGRRKTMLFISEGIDYDITRRHSHNGGNNVGARSIIRTREAIARGDARATSASTRSIRAA